MEILSSLRGPEKLLNLGLSMLSQQYRVGEVQNPVLL